MFALLGAAMELLPVLFGSWFPRNGADQASARALWLGFMGGAQMALGAGFLIQAYLVPWVARVARFETAVKAGALPLPVARGASGR
jgi:uncharacterized membrane protein YoaT (DUF817 family)